MSYCHSLRFASIFSFRANGRAAGGLAAAPEIFFERRFMPPSVLGLAKELSGTLHQRVGIHMELWGFTPRQSKLLRREVSLYISLTVCLHVLCW